MATLSRAAHENGYHDCQYVQQNDDANLFIDLRSENAAYRKMALPMARAVSSAADRLSTELLPCRHSDTEFEQAVFSSGAREQKHAPIHDFDHQLAVQPQARL